MPSNLGTGSVTIRPWAVPTHNRPWQISRLVTCMLFGPGTEKERKSQIYLELVHLGVAVLKDDQPVQDLTRNKMRNNAD